MRCSDNVMFSTINKANDEKSANEDNFLAGQISDDFLPVFVAFTVAHNSN